MSRRPPKHCCTRLSYGTWDDAVTGASSPHTDCIPLSVELEWELLSCCTSPPAAAKQRSPLLYMQVFLTPALPQQWIQGCYVVQFGWQEPALSGNLLLPCSRQRWTQKVPHKHWYLTLTVCSVTPMRTVVWENTLTSVSHLPTKVPNSIQRSSWQASWWLSYWGNLQNIIKLKCSIPCWQQLATGAYPELHESSPHSHNCIFFKDKFWHLPIYTTVFFVLFSLQFPYYSLHLIFYDRRFIMVSAKGERD